MNFQTSLRVVLLGVAFNFVTVPVLAQSDASPTTKEDVRAEVSEAMDAIANYSVQQRNQALNEARNALTQLDAEIESRERALRENWADMSEAARQTMNTRLRDLRQARNTLGERYGALQSGASDGWEELKDGFSDAWDAFSETWKAADEDGKSGQLN